MNCEKAKPLFMDALYDEISPENRAALNHHLEQCDACRKEFAAFKNTGQILNQWQDVEPGVNLSFVEEKVSFVRRIKIWWNQNHGVVQKIGYSFAGILLIFSLMNTNIQFSEGNFSMSMSLFNAGRTADDNYISKADFEAYQAQNREVVAQLMNDYKLVNRTETVAMMKDMYQELDNKRETDLIKLTQGIQQVYVNSENRYNQTDEVLKNLVNYVSYQTRIEQ